VPTKIRLINLGQESLEIVILPKNEGLGTTETIPPFRSMIFPVHKKLRLVIKEPDPEPPEAA